MNAPLRPPGPEHGGGPLGVAIRRPVTITVGVILVCLFGALSVVGLPIQLTPDVTIPTLSITTVWPGASPAEVEADIVEAQEEALKSLPGLDRMTSQTRRGSATITLELEVGASLEEAIVRVTNLLAQVPNYPASARQPVVTTAGSAGQPLAVLVVQALDRGDVAEYRTWIDEDIVPRLERIRGVGDIRLVGGQVQEIHVDFDPAALASRGIDVGRLVNAVRRELADISGGDVTIGKRSFIFRTELLPPAPEDMERIVLDTGPGGNPVLLGEVAQVREALRKAESLGMVNGAASLAMLLYREAGSNVLEVTREIHHVVADLQERFLASEGLDMRIVSDQVEYIEGALSLVQQNLLLGAGFAMIVLLLFLRSLGASMVVAISIPVSIIATALGMSLMGRSINIVSLAGMTFAVGMVVDNSIVVLENIDTWRHRERDLRRAAFFGAREVWGAILASTLTTAAVFIPIIAWQDEVGELLRDIAVALSIAVFASLIVSVLVIPSFAARILRRRKQPAGDGDAGGAPEVVSKPFDPHDPNDPINRGARVVFGRQVHWIVRSPLRSMLVAAIGLGGAAWAGTALMPSLEYLPTGNRNVVFGVVLPPPGYSVDELRRIGLDIADELMPHLGVEKDGKPALDRFFFVGSPDSAFMGAVGEDADRVLEVAALVRQAQATIPDIFAFASQGGLFGQGLGGSRSIEIDIVGADRVAVLGLAQRMMGELMQALPGSQIRPVPGLDAGAPELRVTPRRARASELGMSPELLGTIVSAYVDGAIIGELGRAGEPKRDVLVRAMNRRLDDPTELLALPVATPSGDIVPLGELIEIEETIGPTVIQHIERRRAISLALTPADGVILGDAIDVVRDQVLPRLAEAGAIPEGVSVELSGSASKLDEATERFIYVLLLAVLISYLLLAALFEDFLAPIAILVTVPLAAAGGVMGLRLVDATLGAQTLDMMTAVGFVILIGVVVNNAILVVDGSLNRLREGLALDDAISAAVRGRIRPIFMSATTSLAGLTPLVIFAGAGSELYRGVGAIVLGGLAFSTVLTIYIVPSVFALLSRLRGVR